ncbi:MAG: hypothetical protein HDR37_01740 [Treponema sp.]|nr:hypothetical protein [Treponema sp.]
MGLTFILLQYIVQIVDVAIEELKKKTAKKNSVPQASTKSDLLQDKIFAYCGYKLVATGNYNPVP